MRRELTTHLVELDDEKSGLPSGSGGYDGAGGGEANFLHRHR